MVVGITQGLRSNGSPYARNWVRRSLLGYGSKRGVGIYSMIPMDFWQKRLGYLGTHGTDGTDYSHCYLLAELNTTPTYAFISHMR